MARFVGERVPRLEQSCLQVDDTPADIDPGAELARIERLCQVVVGPGLKPRHDVGLLALRGQEDQVRRPVGGEAPNLGAHVRAGEPGHHPVEDRERRRTRLSHRLPRLRAVHHDGDVVAPLPQEAGEDQARREVVVGDQDPHRLTPVRPARAGAPP